MKYKQSLGRSGGQIPPHKPTSGRERINKQNSVQILANKREQTPFTFFFSSSFPLFDMQPPSIGSMYADHVT